MDARYLIIYSGFRMDDPTELDFIMKVYMMNFNYLIKLYRKGKVDT